MSGAKLSRGSGGEAVPLVGVEVKVEGTALGKRGFAMELNSFAYMIVNVSSIFAHVFKLNVFLAAGSPD